MSDATLGDSPIEFDKAEIVEREWRLAKLLLDANARTTEALEHHLLRAYYRHDSSDTDMVAENLTRAIADHERIIEDLEAALETVEEE